MQSALLLHRVVQLNPFKRDDLLFSRFVLRSFQERLHMAFQLIQRETNML
jgi:hypothetical protein